MSEFLTLKEYALKHKISIFQAVKLAKSGKVETKTKIIDGKEKIFIKDDSIQESKDTKTQNQEHKKAITPELFYQELLNLKDEIKQIKSLLEKLLQQQKTKEIK